MIHALLLFFAPQTSKAPTIAITDRFLVVRANGKLYREALEDTPEKTPERIIYRKDDVFAVWDSRGLSIRRGKGKSRTTKLPDVTLTPKLFTKDEILATKELIAAGTRSKNVTALSGSKRVGDNVYFLARWEDKDHKPWLEALIRVNMADEAPTPQLLGKFDGLSLATHKIDDKLFIMYGLLGVLTHKADGKWGLSTYDSEKKEFAFTDGGDKLTSYTQINQKVFMVQEKQVQGTTLISRVDFSTGSRKEVLEAHGKVVLLPGKPLLGLETKGATTILRNLDTGARVNVAKGSIVRKLPIGVLVWPPTSPNKAVLYDPERWTRLASIKSERTAERDE